MSDVGTSYNETAVDINGPTGVDLAESSLPHSPGVPWHWDLPWQALIDIQKCIGVTHYYLPYIVL